jgi:hypothetical protein
LKPQNKRVSGKYIEAGKGKMREKQKNLYFAEVSPGQETSGNTQ